MSQKPNAGTGNFTLIESPQEKETAVRIRNFSARFNGTRVLEDIDVDIPERRVTGIIGPTGAGKSTLIRSINRINDDVSGFSCGGSIFFDGKDLYADAVDVNKLRRRIGMVFQQPCVFPVSIEENVLFGARHHFSLSENEKYDLVEEVLKSVSLWDDVSHRLGQKASSLSVGQQQKLSIARSLAVRPDVLLMDEPTSSLDPDSKRSVEQLMRDLSDAYTIVFVTHNLRQARRTADYLIFLRGGRLVEAGPVEKLFDGAEHPETDAYLRSEQCSCY